MALNLLNGYHLPRGVDDLILSYLPLSTLLPSIQRVSKGFQRCLSEEFFENYTNYLSQDNFTDLKNKITIKKMDVHTIEVEDLAIILNSIKIFSLYKLVLFVHLTSGRFLWKRPSIKDFEIQFLNVYSSTQNILQEFEGKQSLLLNSLWLFHANQEFEKRYYLKLRDLRAVVGLDLAQFDYALWYHLKDILLEAHKKDELNPFQTFCLGLLKHDQNLVEKAAIDGVTRAQYYLYKQKHKTAKARPTILGGPSIEERQELEKEALKWLESAAKLQDPEAMYKLAKSKGANSKKTAQLVEKAAKGGHSKAQVVLGDWLSAGQITEKNDRVAAFWYHKAALQLHPRACYILGCRYKDGIGVEKNPAEADVWFAKAALLKEADACMLLALRLLEGSYQTADDDLKINCLQVLDPDTYPVAQYKLGKIYTIRSIRVSEVLSASLYYRKAALKGHIKAQYRLGCSLLKYRSIIPEAISWLQKSSQAGFWKAQLKLGTMLALGEDVPKNPVEAASLLESASKNLHNFKTPKKIRRDYHLSGLMNS